MSDRDDTQDKILELIGKFIARHTDSCNEAHSRTVLNLAEAWAWLESPAQPHGGQATTKTA